MSAAVESMRVVGRAWVFGDHVSTDLMMPGAVVAGSVARGFFRNAVNSGLPVIRCAEVTDRVREGDVLEVDLYGGEVVNSTTGARIPCEKLPVDSPPMQILRAGGFDAFVTSLLARGTRPATPVDVCGRRDVKGLYARQRQGLLTGLTGVDDPYEPPLAPELRVPTHLQSVEESVAAVSRLVVEGFGSR